MLARNSRMQSSMVGKLRRKETAGHVTPQSEARDMKVPVLFAWFLLGRISPLQQHPRNGASHRGLGLREFVNSVKTIPPHTDTPIGQPSVDNRALLRSSWLIPGCVKLTIKASPHTILPSHTKAIQDMKFPRLLIYKHPRHLGLCLFVHVPTVLEKPPPQTVQFPYHTAS